MRTIRPSSPSEERGLCRRQPNVLEMSCRARRPQGRANRDGNDGAEPGQLHFVVRWRSTASGFALSATRDDPLPSPHTIIARPF